MFSKILFFTQKLKKILSFFFFWSDGLILLVFNKMSARYLNSHSLSFVLLSKNGVPWKKQLVQLATQITKALFLHTISWYAAEMLCLLPVLSHKDQDLIKWIICTASSEMKLATHPIHCGCVVKNTEQLCSLVLCVALIPAKAPAVSAHYCFYSAMVNIVPKASNSSVLLWK